MKRYTYILFFFVSVMQMQAQIGVNTDAASALLEVYSNTSGSTDKVFRTVNASDVETLQIRNDGRIGLGVANPLTNLDLRGIDGAIGIGYTNMSASDAGAGAIRYNSSLQTLEYSDGTEWIRLQATPEKAFVIATNSYGETIPMTGAASAGLVGVSNWDVVYNITNSFDPLTGTFTAPRSGIYSASVSLVLDPIAVKNGQYELTFRRGLGYNFNKRVVSFLADTPASTPLTNSCQVLLYLEKDEILRVTVYLGGVTTDGKISTDPSLNIITISEM